VTVERILLRAVQQGTAAVNGGLSVANGVFMPPRNVTSNVLCAPFFLLDFRRVVSIDCSAIEQLLKLRTRCGGSAIQMNSWAARDKKGSVGVQLVLVGVNPNLLTQLIRSKVLSSDADIQLGPALGSVATPKGSGRCIGLSGGGAVLAPSLEFAIQWCETQLLAGVGALMPKLLAVSREETALMRCGPVVAAFHKLCAKDGEDGEDLNKEERQAQTKTLERLQAYFERRTLEPGAVLWRQGDGHAKCAILLDSGLLCAERGPQELPKAQGQLDEVVAPGQVYGLLTFLTNSVRITTLRAVKRSIVHVLTAKSLREIAKHDPEAEHLLQRVTLNYSARYCFNEITY
jgi:hypothetical protein